MSGSHLPGTLDDPSPRDPLQVMVEEWLSRRTYVRLYQSQTTSKGSFGGFSYLFRVEAPLIKCQVIGRLDDALVGGRSCSGEVDVDGHSSHWEVYLATSKTGRSSCGHEVNIC